MEYAKHHDIKVAINPGQKELAQKHEFMELLTDITILSINKEEAQMLFTGETAEGLAKVASEHISYVVITDGPHGSVVVHDNKLYKAGMYEDVKVVDRAGAGDAFNSGFVASIAQGGSVGQAITLAAANSTSVVGKIGAKVGILKTDARLHQMPIEIQNL